MHSMLLWASYLDKDALRPSGGRYVLIVMNNSPFAC